MVSRIDYGSRVLRRIAALCEAEPARESCGFVVRKGGDLDVVQIPNVADRYNQFDPVRFPRTSRDSYLMDARALRELQVDLDSSQAEIVAVWHSHIDAGAYFSAKDRADAVVGGEQVMPGVEYLVFSVRGGLVVEAKSYRYADERFVEGGLGNW